MTGPANDSADHGRRPGPSFRLRLTLSYAGFLVVAGAALLLVALLSRRTPRTNCARRSRSPARGAERRVVLRRETVRLDELAADAIAVLDVDARQAGVELDEHLGPAVVLGDPTLLGRLVANLVGNAIAHNLPVDGRVDVHTGTTPSGAAELVVENTGDVLSPDAIATFTEPFVRGANRIRRNRRTRDGAGLGLAIVASIVRSHDAMLELAPRDTGGLRARVVFPRSTA